jgi:hypothetical protein
LSQAGGDIIQLAFTAKRLLEEQGYGEGIESLNSFEMPNSSRERELGVGIPNLKED